LEEDENGECIDAAAVVVVVDDDDEEDASPNYYSTHIGCYMSSVSLFCGVFFLSLAASSE
jgi:hypothetical protein